MEELDRLAARLMTDSTNVETETTDLRLRLSTPVTGTWREVFGLWGDSGVTEYLNYLLEIWDALGRPPLQLNQGVVIHDLRAWLSGPVLLPDLALADREVWRHDCPDGPQAPGYQGEGVVWPSDVGWRVSLVQR